MVFWEEIVTDADSPCGNRWRLPFRDLNKYAKYLFKKCIQAMPEKYAADPREIPHEKGKFVQQHFSFIYSADCCCCCWCCFLISNFFFDVSAVWGRCNEIKQILMLRRDSLLLSAAAVKKMKRKQKKNAAAVVRSFRCSCWCLIFWHFVMI